MLQSYSKYLGVLLVAAVTLFSCGKQDFNFDSNPPDVGGSKDSAKQLIDTLLKFDDSKIVQASAFPGLICETEPRLASVNLSLDLNYKSVGVNLRISKPPEPLLSTGYYAAPGELITIDIPQGMYQMSAQIGGWTDNVGAYPNPPRDGIVFTRQQLSPGRNYLRNLYGGTIYLNAAVPIANPVSVTLGNVVKSPDFVLGESKDAEWKARLQASCVPWLELRSRFVSFLVPRDRCLNTSYPSMEAALKQWDSIISNDYQAWQGLSLTPADPVDQAPILPYRIVFEIAMAPGVGGHSGNPVVVGNWNNWFDGVVNVTNTSSDGLWGLLHEIGHNNQQTAYWSWSTLGEVSNNLFSFKVADRLRRAGYPKAWPPNHPALGVEGGVSIVDSAIAFASSTGVKNFDGTDTRINSPFARCIFFVQLFDYIKPNMPGINKSNKEGWALMGELYSRARRAVRPNSSDLTMHDFVYRALCDMTQYDWAGHFNQWGVSISDLAQAEMTSKYTPIGFKAWTYNPIKGTGGKETYNPDPYATTNWKINSFSSQEAEGEELPNGLASSIIDGNINTFWHSNWSANDYAGVAPPHWIIIDLGNSIPFSSFRFTQRQDNPGVRIKNLYIDISTNNSTWTTIAGNPFVMDNAAATQTRTLSASVTARYVRLRMPAKSDMYGNDIYAAIAEFAILK